jgi:hypothetical protein
MQGIKFDNGDEKIKWMLVPWLALKEITKVLMAGAVKYLPDNWKKVPDSINRYKEALLRHVIADAEGELVDKDYGLLHLAHAGCCILFLIWFYIQEKMFVPFTPDYKAIEERYKQQKEEAFRKIRSVNAD